MDGKMLIHGLSRDALEAVCREMGEPSFRASQIRRWLFVSAVSGWDEMKNLPSGLRRELANRFEIDALVPVERHGAAGSTVRIVGRLRDGEPIETVLIPDGRRLTVCVSSQVGCKFACGFCASGQLGFRRNLEAGEIAAQALTAIRESGRHPSNVVFMGIGEPFDNYDEVLTAARIMNDGEGLKIGARRITLSTCGLVPGIRRLGDEHLQLELSVSLHAAEDELRSRLMPVNRRYPLDVLLSECDAYARKTRRIVTFEYAMICGVNDSSEQASLLARRLRSIPCRVNLIPLSPVREFGQKPSSPDACRMFVRTLAGAGINVTIRSSKGGSIEAACGQLRIRAMQ